MKLEKIKSRGINTESFHRYKNFSSGGTLLCKVGVEYLLKGCCSCYVVAS